MDPCPFARLIIESLALQLPMGSKPSAGAGVHPSSTPCYCKITLKGFPSQTALLPLCSGGENSPPESGTCAPGFHLDPVALRRMSGRPISVRVCVYSGRMGQTCGMSSGKLLGSVNLCVDLKGAEANPIVFHSGWMRLGKKDKRSVEKHKGDHDAKLHLTVRTEPDPRFVFQFGGEPECSPVIFQIQGNIRQPVFSCKFSADRNSRSRYVHFPLITIRFILA